MEGGLIEKFAQLKQPDYNKICNALIQNLLPTFAKNAPRESYDNNMENFLTCFAIIKNLRENILDESAANLFEETSLNAIHKSLFANCSIADMRLLFSELPSILIMPYPAVKNICSACIEIIPSIMDFFRMNALWKEYVEVEYVMRMLKAFERS